MPTSAASPVGIAVEGLVCPNCSAPLEARSGLRVLRCAYCSTRLLVIGKLGSRRLAVQPQIGRAEAIDTSRDWLGRGWSRDRRLGQEAEFGEPLLCFLPFYRVEADCLGIALGTEQRTRTVGTGKRRRTETYEVDIERKVERSYDETYAAVNVAEWGVHRIELQGDRLVAFESAALDRLGMVYPPAGSQSRVRAAALAGFVRRADPSRGLKRVHFKFLETLRERLSVVYYPLWLVRYRFRSRSYQILVDGEDGSLAYGKAPGNDLYRAVVAITSQAAVLYGATTILQVGGGSLEVLGATAVATIVALTWVWRKFRHGGVVVEGSGVVEPAGLLSRVGRSLAEGGSFGKWGIARRRVGRSR